jgi:prepilin-type N-terminal cleavage/methylation domain-containing protein
VRVAFYHVGVGGGLKAARGRAAPGFTLLEILLVLTLIALLGSVMIGGAASLLKTAKEQDPEPALLALLQKTRGEAVEKNQIVELVQLPEEKGFLASTGGLEVLPKTEGGARVTLLRAEFSGASLIGGQMEERPLERMRFYPDGACDPVRVQVRRGETRRVYAIDPWTAAPLPEGGKTR